MRTSLFSILVISLLSVPLPARAWEHILNDYGNGQVMNAATSLDRTGTTSLMFGCLIGQGAFRMQVVATAAAGVSEQPTTLDFLVSGINFPVAAMLGETNGYLIATSSSETAPVADVARSIYAASTPIEITVASETYSFDGGNFGDAFGAMLDACA